MTSKPFFDRKEIESMALEAIECCEQICQMIAKGEEGVNSDSAALNVLASRAGECCERIRTHLLLE